MLNRFLNSWIDLEWILFQHSPTTDHSSLRCGSRTWTQPPEEHLNPDEKSSGEKTLNLMTRTPASIPLSDQVISSTQSFQANAGEPFHFMVFMQLLAPQSVLATAEETYTYSSAWCVMTPRWGFSLCLWLSPIKMNKSSTVFYVMRLECWR